MIYLSLSYLFTLLFLILTPYSLVTTLIILTILLLLLIAVSTRGIIAWEFSLLILLGILIGILMGYLSLKNYNHAINALPLRDQFAIEVVNSDPARDSIEAKIVNATQHPELKGYHFYLYDLNKKIHSFVRGEQYHLTMQLKPLNTPQFPTEMHRRLHYLSKALIGQGSRATEIKLLQPPNAINQFRAKIAGRFEQAQFKYSGYMTALTVGITDGLKSKDWDLLRQTGTIHLISISGLHISFIALWGFIFVRTMLGVMMIKRIPPYRIAAIVAIIIAFLYALIAGFSLPTQRSLIMFSIAMLALLFYTPMLTLYSLAIAAFLILLFSPLSLLSIGFWLSFSSVALLIILSRYRVRPWLLLLITQFAVSFIVMPFTASFFGEVSLISPVANFFAIPWTTMTILLPLLVGVVIDPLLPIVADTLFYFANHSLAFMISCLKWLNQLSFSSIQSPEISFISALLITFTLLIIIAKQAQWKIILLLTLMLLSLLPPIQKKPKRSLHLFPVSEGLSLFIKTPNRKILFDTGLYFRRYDAGERVIVPTLKSLNIDHLDAIILSKENQQHIGGTRSVRYHYPDATVITQPPLLNYIDDAEDCHHYSYNDIFLSIEPFKEIKSSCAFLVTINDYRFWLLADITKTEWNQLINRYSKPDILLFPNQGRSRFFDLKDLKVNIDPYSDSNDDPNENSSGNSSGDINIDKTTILLFSTKKIHPTYQPFLSKEEYYNAYEGIIDLSLDDSLKIHQDLDRKRYWWMTKKKAFDDRIRL